MSKRLLCLALCVLMLLPLAMTSCEKKELDLSGESKAITLTMLTITETQVYYTDAEYAALSDSEKAEVDEIRAQYDAVEAAINKITKKDMIQLEIFYYTEEQYDEIVAEKLANSEVLADQRNSASKEYNRFRRALKRENIDDEVVVYERFVAEYPDLAPFITPPSGYNDDQEETEEDENAGTKYPEVDPDQVDILFVGSYDKYIEYIENGWLSKLDDSLKTGEAKKLTTAVYPAFLSAAKTEKGTYAVPNNTVIGEYTALLVNKAMCDRYFDPAILEKSDFTLYDILPLVNDVAKYETGIDPVWKDSYRGFTNVHFWSVDYKANGEGVNEFSIDPDTFSVVGAVHKPNFTSGNTNTSYFEFSNIIGNSQFQEQLLALKTFEYNNYYGAAGSSNDFAVGVIKGTGRELDAYEEDYYTVILEYPTASEEDLFNSMYAVSQFTSDLTRSMEIITLINTDPQFRNLLQYGIEGTNYTLDANDCAARTNENLYTMDIYKTGSMFIAYPDADLGMDYKTLEYAKAQDLEVKTNPTVGFEIIAEDLPDVANIDFVNAKSEAVWEQIEACTSIEDTVGANGETVKGLETVLSELTTSLNDDASYKKALDSTLGKPDYSVAALYKLWCQNMGYIAQ